MVHAERRRREARGVDAGGEHQRGVLVLQKAKAAGLGLEAPQQAGLMDHVNVVLQVALAGPAHGPHAVDHSRLDLDEALAPIALHGPACCAPGGRRGDGVIDRISKSGANHRRALDRGRAVISWRGRSQSLIRVVRWQGLRGVSQARSSMTFRVMERRRENPTTNSSGTNDRCAQIAVARRRLGERVKSTLSGPSRKAL